MNWNKEIADPIEALNWIAYCYYGIATLAIFFTATIFISKLV